MEICHYNSPNFSKKIRPVNSIKLVVIHYTGMQSERESIKRLCNPNSKVSCHYLVSQNGKIFKLVKETHTAWHAGKSCWGKYKNLNENSIGIELVNSGHQFGYTGFKTKQILALVKLCKKLIIRYKIKKKNIVGHSDIAPLRKKDPGEKFPWKYLSKKKIGIWHDCKSAFLTKNVMFFSFLVENQYAEGHREHTQECTSLSRISEIHFEGILCRQMGK